MYQVDPDKMESEARRGGWGVGGWEGTGQRLPQVKNEVSWAQVHD